MQLILTETPRVTPGPENLKQEGPSALSATARQMTIATFNIENFPGNTSSAKRLKEIAKVIVINLKGPDVVALQEVQARILAPNKSLATVQVPGTCIVS